MDEAIKTIYSTKYLPSHVKYRYTSKGVPFKKSGHAMRYASMLSMKGKIVCILNTDGGFIVIDGFKPSNDKEIYGWDY